MPNDWYCRVDRTVHGPLSPQDLGRMAEAGQLKATDHVKEGEDGQWIPARSVNGLTFQAAPEAVPSAPAAPPGGPARRRHGRRKGDWFAMLMVASVLLVATFVITWVAGVSWTYAFRTVRGADSALVKAVFGLTGLFWALVWVVAPVLLPVGTMIALCAGPGKPARAINVLVAGAFLAGLWFLMPYAGFSVLTASGYVAVNVLAMGLVVYKAARPAARR